MPDTRLSGALCCVASYNSVANLWVCDMQVDCERAAAAAVRWLRSCNAVVLLEQGGVYSSVCCCLMQLSWHFVRYGSCSRFATSVLWLICLLQHISSLPAVCHYVPLGSNFAVCTGAQPSTALLDCKPSVRLSMPEDVTAVAHGDATLNLHSFMHHVRVT